MLKFILEQIPGFVAGVLVMLVPKVYAFVAAKVAEARAKAEPDISGATDAYTAMNLDPMSNALKFGSESVAASHVFAPLTDEAATSVANTLADYAGNSADMKVLQDAAGPGDLVPSLVEKIKADPSLAVTLGQKMGVDPRTLYRAAAAPSGRSRDPPD